MSDTLRVSNLHFGNAASNNNQPQMGFTSVGIGSTANYGFLQFFGTSNTLCWTANGTVGIGTTAPGSTMEIYTNGGVGGTTQMNITSFAGANTTTNTSVLNLRIQGAGGGMVDNSISAQYNSSGVGTYSLAFKPLGTTAMTIIGTGNVGIGITNPTAPLTIGSFFQNGGTHPDTYGSNILLTTTVGFGVGMQLRVGANQTVNSSDLQFTTCDNTGNQITRMTILGSSNAGGGFVGIGTTAPGVALDVNGSINTKGIFTLSDAYPAANGFIRMVTAGNTNFIQSGLTTTVDSKADLVFGSINAGTEWLRIKSNGNIGINVASPLAKIHTYQGETNVIRLQTSSVDNAYIVAAYDYLSISANHSSTGTRENTGRGSSQIVLQSPGAGGLITFNTNPSINTGLLERMRITSNGDVGIGVASPDVKLHVAGGLRATAPVYSYTTSYFYVSGATTWGTTPETWPFSGNVFLLTMTGPRNFAGDAIRATYIVYHSRHEASGNNAYGIISPIGSTYGVGSYVIYDHYMSFTFNAGNAQTVQIKFLALN